MVGVLRPACAGVLAMVAACTGTIDPSPMASRPDGAPGAGGGAGGRGGAGGAGPIASGGTGGAAPAGRCADATVVHPGRAPLRRLTRFEYNNTVRDLLGDSSSPGNALPSEEIGNGFGNDADGLSVSSLLAEQYASVAEGIARRVIETPALWSKLAPCAATVTASSEESCARAVIEAFAPRAFRRPLQAGEADGLLALQRSTRARGTFPTSVAAVVEAVLQSPEFLYRVEWGTPDGARPGVRAPHRSGDGDAPLVPLLGDDAR